jgi:hypothetical protein
VINNETKAYHVIRRERRTARRDRKLTENYKDIDFFSSVGSVFRAFDRHADQPAHDFSLSNLQEIEWGVI